VEFFTSPNRLQALISKMAAFRSLTYIAVNVKGETYSNIGELRVSDRRLRINVQRTVNLRSTGYLVFWKTG
jgi:hypothetical protein